MVKDNKMETAIRNIGNLFKEGSQVQWVVPVYQRPYVWESEADNQIPGVWDDWKSKTEELLKLGKDKTRPHYFGAIIYHLHNQSIEDEFHKRDLVDGQQRLTTFQLALAALRDVGTSEGYRESRNINHNIFNMFGDSNRADEPDLDKYRLLPSRHDRDVFKRIVAINKEKMTDTNAGEPPAGISGLEEAYNYFRSEIRKFIEERKSEETSVKKLVDALKEVLLERFQVVLIKLGEHDEAQQIFASLNGQAKPLSPFDLVRNDIFFRARGDKKEVEKQFEDDWGYFENRFWTTLQGHGHSRKPRADHFIADVVVAQTAKEVKQRRIVAKYKESIKETKFPTVADELDLLIRYGKTYSALIEQPANAATNRIAKMLKLWGLLTMNPLIMWIDNHPHPNDDDKEKLFKMVESYIVRRHICYSNTKAFNKIAAEILACMHNAKNCEDNIIEAFQYFLKNTKSDSAKMPTDNEIISACEQRPIYGSGGNAKKLKYILEYIEMDRDRESELTESVNKKLSVEHIMPQKWAKNWTIGYGNKVTHEEFWDAVDENPEFDKKLQPLMDERQGVIHTIGNLTLVTSKFNSKLSNKSWGEKREEIRKTSKLELNSDIVENDEWNESEIKARSKRLADDINKIWPSS